MITAILSALLFVGGFAVVAFIYLCLEWRSLTDEEKAIIEEWHKRNSPDGGLLP
jgi:hypothetical protein